jgi:hypothetical protein
MESRIKKSKRIVLAGIAVIIVGLAYYFLVPVNKRCEVHGARMHRGVVKVTYGLPLITKDYTEACKEYFPNSNSVVFGGCVVLPGPPDFERVIYCSQCRRAESEWWKEFNKKAMKEWTRE